MTEESSNTESTQEQTSEKAEESTAVKHQERTFTLAELDRVVSDRLSRMLELLPPPLRLQMGLHF